MAAKKKPEEKPIEIYALIDPRDSRTRYIGKARDSKKRYKGHMSETRRSTPVYKWISELRSEGMVPVMHVIATCSDGDWPDVERKAIEDARMVCDDMLNVAAGGNQPYCPSEVRADNGRRVVALRTATPLAKRIYELKRAVGHALVKGRISESGKEKLRLAAQKRPDLFGCYADL